jgi:hypothetical protein
VASQTSLVSVLRCCEIVSRNTITYTHAYRIKKKKIFFFFPLISSSSHPLLLLKMPLPILNVDIILMIITQLKDSDSLFQFLLMNKFFSQIAVSVLWENPFKYTISTLKNNNYKNYLIIQTYIKSFNEEERNEINNILRRDEIKIEDKEQEKSSYFLYGKYLRECNIQNIRKAIESWFNRITKFYSKSEYYYGRKKIESSDFEKCIINSIMRQCQRLDDLNWDLCFKNDDLLETMQYKIKDLKNLTVNHLKLYRKIENIAKNHFDYFKNHCKNISSLTINKICDDKIIKELISFIKLQNYLNEFIFNGEVEQEFKDLIISILELSANNLTKLILNNVNFSNISFDYIDKCINLEILGLRSNKGLKFEDMDPYTLFKNLKKLDLSYNDWSSEVTSLILTKAGKNLCSLTIGEKNIKQAINDDTLMALIKFCPNIYSLSISKICRENIKMVLSYIKDLKLVTLQLFQNRTKGTIMDFEDLLNYIKNEKLLLKLGLGKHDDYWNYYNNKRRNFEKLLKEHNVKLVAYKPNSLDNARFHN